MKRAAVFAALFLIPAFATFLLWPIEKADYSNCNGNLFCMGEFESKPGGGAIFLANIKKVHHTQPQKTSVMQFEDKADHASYNFAVVSVAAISVIVGLGSLVIGGVVYRKIRRDRQSSE